MKLGSTPLSKAFMEQSVLPDCPIIDVHSHPLPFGGAYLPCFDAGAFASALERNGIILCLIASHVTLSSPSEGVTEDIRIAREYPERIRAWYVFNPRYDSLEHVQRLWKENPATFVGFKVHPDSHSVKLDGPGYAPVLAWAEERGLPVLSHTWTGSACNGEIAVGGIMQRHPGLLFFAGHSLWDNWQGACELAVKYPNFYMELTAAGAIRCSLEHMVREAGSTKILFGTDLPWFATMHGVGCMLSADITDEDRRNILYRNAASALGGFAWFKEGFAAKLP